MHRPVVWRTDIGGKLQAWKTFSCTNSAFTEGMPVDFTGGRRINYWVALNGQKVQYSGTARSAARTSKVADPTYPAGLLAIDDIAAGGPKVTATFDVTLTKNFRIAR